MTNAVISDPSRLVPAPVSGPDLLLGRRFRVALGATLFLFAGLGLAAAFVPVGGAVIGSGQLGASSRVKEIAHPTGGTVAAILVHNGQHVRKGQLLVRLDAQVAETEAGFAALSVDQMLARKARLEAEQSGASAIAFPAALRMRADADARQAMVEESRMFAIRRQEEAGMIAQLRARIGQYQQQVEGYRAQIAALRQQSALIGPEREALQGLYEKRLVTLNRLNQLERTAVDLNGSVGALEAQIAGIRARMGETREQMMQIAQSRRAEAGTQLAALNSELNQSRIRSASARDSYDRTSIRAPHAGVVENLSVTTVGGVVRPAQEIMRIVPSDDALVIEGGIGLADIEQVKTGQAARVRLTAVRASATPELTGTVTYVGTDPLTDAETKRGYFPVRIALVPADAAREQARLRTGMPVELFIETGDRSLFSYISRPLRDQFVRAFRDD